MNKDDLLQYLPEKGVSSKTSGSRKDTPIFILLLDVETSNFCYLLIFFISFNCVKLEHDWTTKIVRGDPYKSAISMLYKLAETRSYFSYKL